MNISHLSDEASRLEVEGSFRADHGDDPEDQERERVHEERDPERLEPE